MNALTQGAQPALRQATENLAITISNKTTIAGGITATASGMTEKTGLAAIMGQYGSEIAIAGVVCGIVFGFAGLVVQVIFTYRRDKRETRESTWRMGIDPERRRANMWRPGDPDRRQNAGEL